MPQLIEQWRIKSADGIAIGFISIWFMGDLLNFVAAIWVGLLPELIFLAVWFCIADSVMIFSYVYYTHIYPRLQQSRNNSRHSVRSAHSHHEGEALLTGHSSTFTDITLKPQLFGLFTKYVLPILIVIGAGCLGYLMSGSTNNQGGHDDTQPNMARGPQVVGYLSAFVYLGARIPQILKNHRRKCVEGLSLLFFMFSTLGNLTYAGRILFYRNDADYVLLNLSWLLGSLGTIFEDCIIFLQIFMYKDDHLAVTTT
ncbi:hypothetical protein METBISCDRAFT_27429 [Metschnikowia bicuspidata]|uniref:PQ-loop-domain-containing protein n=1 Tax=Metschnikowia bicuspidata TaxID=27322 RepID=A0A4P9ZC04_9ASCO|nr:hypothetical protein METBISCDRAFT_27429 [Metschnikowia bicuspidata]